MKGLALREPSSVERLVTDLGGGTSETVAYLLAQGLAANPAALADVAIAFLLGDPRRFAIGYSDDRYWTTRTLLRAVTPHASEASLSALQDVILQLNQRCDRHDGPYGRARFTLLDAIAPGCRSPEVTAQLEEIKRRSGRTGPPGPHRIRGGMVRSPISGHVLGEMNDEQLRESIAQHGLGRRDGRDSLRHESFLVGGAEEMANEIEPLARMDALRFAHLAVSLPDDTHPAYFDAILRGVAAASEEIGVDETVALVERCFRLPGRPCGRWIGRPLRRIAHHSWPTRLYEIVTWYAMHDLDPSEEAVGHEGNSCTEA